MKRVLPIIIVVMLIVSGCNNTFPPSDSSSIYQGKAIEGISDVAWRFDTETGAFLSQPLVTDATTYVGSPEKLYAIDSRTGELKWELLVVGNPSKPRLTGDTLLYHDSVGLHVVSAENGNEKWSRKYNQPLPLGMYPTVTIAGHSMVFFFNQSSLSAININDGEDVWEYNGDVSYTTPFILDDDNIIFSSAGTVKVLDARTGKEEASIDTDMLISSVQVGEGYIYSVGVGSITAYKKDSYEQQWQYTNESFEMTNLPMLTVLDDIVVATEVKNGTIITLDSGTGMELWNIQMGDMKYRPTYPWLITEPAALENTLYIGAWGGEHSDLKGTPAYSELFAIDLTTGAEKWRYQVDEYIMHAPAFANGKVIVTNMQGSITAYNEGEADKSAASSGTTPSNEAISTPVPEIDDSSTEDEEYELKDFEGYWKSDKQAFHIAFTDSSFGVITFYEQGGELPVPFEYRKIDYDRVMMIVGAEQKTMNIRLDADKNSLGYVDEQGRDYLVRQEETQKTRDSVMDLIGGFEGRWCDSSQIYCFELKLTDLGEGILDYYQDREPIQQSFRITYMDMHDITIEIEGSEQVFLSLSNDLNEMTYESDFMEMSLNRQ